jgi:hypothetical protein
MNFVLTTQSVSFEKDELSYIDLSENFVTDCKTLKIEPFTLPNSILCATHVGELFCFYSSDSQLPASEEFKTFSEKCVELLPDFISAQAERVKPPEPTFDEIKQSAIVTIYRLCKDKRSEIGGTLDPLKTATWSVYREFGLAYRNGTLSEKNKQYLLQEIALRQIDGETLDTFVDKILDNSDLFMRAATIVSGAEKRANLDLDQAQNEAEIASAIQKLKDTLKVLE